MFAGDSRTLSSATLLRGVAVVRGHSMSLESDEQYQAMLQQREHLMVPHCRHVSG